MRLCPQDYGQCELLVRDYTAAIFASAASFQHAFSGIGVDVRGRDLFHTPGHNHGYSGALHWLCHGHITTHMVRQSCYHAAAACLSMHGSMLALEGYKEPLSVKSKKHKYVPVLLACYDLI